MDYLRSSSICSEKFSFKPRVPFAFQPVDPEILTDWKVPRVSICDFATVFSGGGGGVQGGYIYLPAKAVWRLPYPQGSLRDISLQSPEIPYSICQPL